MIKIKKILCIALMFCFIGSYVYGYSDEPMSEEKLKNNLEATYGINIIIPENETYENYKECLLILDRGLRRFPPGVIKEITKFNTEKGINTNVVLGKAEKVSDLFVEYKISDNNAVLYINTLQNSLFNDSCTASELGFIHEVGHYIGDYLLKVYGYEKIKYEFEKLNSEYTYGEWVEGYDNVFVNKHSAKSFSDDIADLIWHSVVHPDKIRNINDGIYTVIHKKIEYLTTVMDHSLSSITSEDKLWQEALPQKPDVWALDSINAMKEKSLIPEQFDGIYNSYISKEDFYTLALNIVESKLGKENFIKSFDLIEKENYVIIDPVKGEAYVDNGTGDAFILETEINNEKETRLFEAYQIGLIDESLLQGSKEYMTRLEIAKLFSFIANELGMDISDYKAVNYEDLTNVKDSEKPFIYYVASKGLIKGDGISFNPYNYCTYQEAYIILLRFYEML